MKRNLLFTVCTLFAASAMVLTSCDREDPAVANQPTDEVGLPQTQLISL